MKKHWFSYLSVFAFVLMALSSCDGSGELADGGSGTQPTSQEQAQATNEMVALNDVENALANVGLKFKETFNYQNGVQTTTYRWDVDYLKQFAKDHPEATNADMIAALQKYVDGGNAIIQKWGDRLIAHKELEAKISLAQQTINALK
jgi:hypothetical protein